MTALVTGLLVVAPPVVPAATADTSADNGKIAFSAYDQTAHTRTIYVMNADGTGRTQLTSGNGELDDEPSWSPNGSKIAFSAGTLYNGTMHIFVMNADGTSLTQLTDVPGAITPSWSPDGTKIAFAETNSASDNGIYMTDPNGTQVTRLTTGDYDAFPTWSPDGSRIAYEHWDTNLNAWQIWAMNADGTGQANLSDDLGGDDREPAWSPNGSKIAFMSTRDFNDEIYVMNADGTGQTDVSNNSAPDDMPAWSLDGTRIIFTSSRDDRSQLYVMNADGTGQANLSNDATQEFGPAWGHTYVPPPPPIPLDSTPTSVSLGSAAKVGVRLTAALSGTWQAGTTTLTPQYQWYIVAGPSWTPIPNATSATFTPTASQYDQHLAVKVTATAPAGYEQPDAIASTAIPVDAGSLRTTTPTIRGVARVGRLLKVATGTWWAGSTPLPAAHFRYHWYVGSKLIQNAAGPSLKVTRSMTGRPVRAKVAGWYSGYARALGLTTPVRIRHR